MKVEFDLSPDMRDGLFEALLRYHAQLAATMAQNVALFLNNGKNLHQWEDIQSALKTLDACNELLRYGGYKEFTIGDSLE